MKKSDGNSAKYDLEYWYKGDDSWYGVLVMVDGEMMTVKFEGYSKKFDVKLLAVTSNRRRKSMNSSGGLGMSVSPQLQDNECGSVKEGVIVCAACNAFGKDDMLFYDAVVEAIHNENHTFYNEVEECVCTFVLSWLHGPKKDDLATSRIEGICIIKGTTQVDPKISSFLELANQKLKKSSCKSTSTSEQDNSTSKGSSRTKRVRYLSSEQKLDSSFKAS
uniref:SAWADEE domain-containing protein n=1 Tax=Solanum tuberosum TaxID=4113 RepID=M1BGX0_SOLTU